MNKLLALADRVEKLTGPDREVDCLIAVAVNEGSLPGAVKSISDVPEVMASGYVRHTYNGSSSYQRVLSYTSSIDAAMTLLGAHGVLLYLSDIGADGLPLARVGRPDLDDAPTLDGIASCIMTDTAPVAGLAIAVTAAALRARAHGGGA